ncbi:hypothetical protein WJ542_04005 [Paraburkholderia sp. B3]|uniref:hypothetical protein n=1 Tax=Paraburkholderia sp. B3 TaxID=3134791 RepID=UPI0039828A34
MIGTEEYQSHLAEHGRRVANRVAYSSMSKDERGSTDLSMFYACYGNERDLPEDERSRESNPANDFDPCGWFAFYASNPWVIAARRVMKDNNLTDWWNASDAPTRRWMLSLAHKTDDELRTVAEELEQRGEQEWANFVYSLTESDLVALYLLRNRDRRWPDPNPPAHLGQVAKEQVTRIRKMK